MRQRLKRPPDAGVIVRSDPWTRPFWDNAAQHRVTIATCAACGHMRMPPTPFCPECLSQDIDWVDVPGTGTLYSFTIVRRATLADGEDCIPYAPALVELQGAGGLRIISNIVDCQEDALFIGLRLRPVFDAIDGQATVIRFTPDEKTT